MRIPYVIDNETHRLADVLNEMLAGHAERSLDQRWRTEADAARGLAIDVF